MSLPFTLRFPSLLMACMIALCTSVYGQSGSIVGSVIEAEVPLVGATIVLKKDRSIGANSNLDGKFVLPAVPAGEQAITISYLGYNSKDTTVEVPAGGVVEIQIKLEPAIVLSDEVVISVQRRGQTQAINQQLSSDKIANIVSADRIQELPDVNAAEAIGRLPGVALSRSGGEGQKVIIRGMEPKFSAITVNGVRLPSNSSTDRSVDLSLIAPELLDAIEVFKSPLPDMDAEAVGGTVNLRLRKAPENFRLLTRGLWGYNNLVGQFKDYKGVVQASNRLLKGKLGVIGQGSIERFNRSGDFLSNGWRRGRTNDSTGITEILGNSLTLEDRQEIRRRYNASLSMDYAFNPNHNLSLFGVYSLTERDQFRSTESYTPSSPSISYEGRGWENDLSLLSFTLTGEHNFGWMQVDWSGATSHTVGSNPYDYEIRFSDTENDFEDDIDQNGLPRTFFGGAIPNLETTNLVAGEFFDSRTQEDTRTALVNFNVPIRLFTGVQIELKFGGKNYEVDRSRDFNRLSENFYYLGGEFTANAAQAFEAEGGGLSYLETNPNLIGINSFLQPGSGPDFVNEAGEIIQLRSNLDPDIIRSWYEAQRDLLSNNREGLINRYEVSENIRAGYAMLKIKVGDKLTVIPGFRYEYSDNEYRGGFATLSGRYGVNGVFRDTTTFQQYGEFLPHLHAKFKPFEWLDFRLSYSKTMARPDFAWVSPRFSINNTNTTISAGNPDLKHSVATNYDFHVSAYKGTLGLLTFGVFRKDIQNTFFPWRVNLADSALLAQTGYPDDYSGYFLNSFTNLDSSRVWGWEVDLQTNLGFLPRPFNGIVLNANYSRLFSQTQAFFLTSETVLVNPFPPVFQTTYTTNRRTVPMISQTPHIFHLSVGYDWKKFSARISGIFQGSRATSYSLDPGFDDFTLRFWRWDASIKQGIKDRWGVFLNLNNITNQQDISFTRNEAYLETIQTFGMTGNIGVQYQIR